MRECVIIPGMSYTPGSAAVELAQSFTPRSVEAIAADPQPGDIYEGSWGYDQTNAEFWQVIKRTPKTVTLRRLSAEVREGRLFPRPGVWFQPTRYWDGVATVAEPEDKVCHLRNYRDLPGTSGDWLKIKSYYGVGPWDGQGAYDTFAAGQQGH